VWRRQKSPYTQLPATRLKIVESRHILVFPGNKSFHLNQIQNAKPLIPSTLIVYVFGKKKAACSSFINIHALILLINILNFYIVILAIPMILIIYFKNFLLILHF